MFYKIDFLVNWYLEIVFGLCRMGIICFHQNYTIFHFSPYENTYNSYNIL